MKRYAAGFLLSIGLMSPGPSSGQGPAPNTSPTEYSVSAGFTAMHANIAPGQCRCFLMYGGSGQLTAELGRRLSFVADIGATRATNVSDVHRAFTLATYQVGARYTRPFGPKYKPYAQALVGVAHLDSNFVIDSVLTRAAYSGGMGLDYRYSDRFDIHLVEVMYVGTQFDNGSNNRQNQIRITGGLVFHIPNPKR